VWNKRLLVIGGLLVPFLLFSQEPSEEEAILLPEVVITEELPHSVEKTMDSEELEAIVTSDIVTILEEGMGFSLNQYGAAGSAVTLNAGGFRGDRVGVVLDGVPLRSAQGGAFDLSLIPVVLLQSVEYQQRDDQGLMGGTLSFSSVNPISEESLEIRLRAGGYDDSVLDSAGTSLLWEGLWRENHFTLGGEFYGAANRYGYIHQGVSYQQDSAEVWQGSFFGSMGQEDLNRSWSATALAVYGDKNIPGPHFGSPGNQIDQWFRFGWSWEDPLWSAAVAAEHKGMVWDQESTDSHRSQQLFGSIKRLWYIGLKTDVSLKAQVRTDFIQSSKLGNPWQMEGIVNGQFQYLPHPQWTLGVSGDVLVGTYTTLAPGVYVKWQDKGAALELYGNRGVRPPAYNDLYWPEDGYSQGNADLQDETAWSLGGKGRYSTDMFGLSLASSYSYVENQIRWLPRSGGIWSPENEDLLRITTVSGEFWLEGHGSRLQLDGAFNDTHLESGKQSPLIPQLTGNLKWTNSWLLDKLGVLFHVESKRYTSDLNIYWLPPHYRWDLFGRHSLTKGVTIEARLENLLNRTFYQYENYPLPGRSLSLEFSLSM